MSDYTTRTITQPSDQHGEPCDWCALADQVCVANIYYTDTNGDDDIAHTCRDCVPAFIEARHNTWHGTDPLAEISTAPLPAELPAAA